MAEGIEELFSRGSSLLHRACAFGEAAVSAEDGNYRRCVDSAMSSL